MEPCGGLYLWPAIIAPEWDALGEKAVASLGVSQRLPTVLFVLVSALSWVALDSPLYLVGLCFCIFLLWRSAWFVVAGWHWFWVIFGLLSFLHCP